jgi:hypothetical protein
MALVKRNVTFQEIEEKNGEEKNVTFQGIVELPLQQDRWEFCRMFEGLYEFLKQFVKGLNFSGSVRIFSENSQL